MFRRFGVSLNPTLQPREPRCAACTYCTQALQRSQMLAPRIGRHKAKRVSSLAKHRKVSCIPTIALRCSSAMDVSGDFWHALTILSKVDAAWRNPLVHGVP